MLSIDTLFLFAKHIFGINAFSFFVVVTGGYCHYMVNFKASEIADIHPLRRKMTHPILSTANNLSAASKGKLTVPVCVPLNAWGCALLQSKCSELFIYIFAHFVVALSVFIMIFNFQVPFFFSSSVRSFFCSACFEWRFLQNPLVCNSV